MKPVESFPMAESSGRVCYLVVHIQTSQNYRPGHFSLFVDGSYLSLLKAGTYSESARSLTGAIASGRFAFDVLSMSGETYEKAREALKKACTEPPYESVYGWAWKLLPKDEQ